jgi:DNA-binding MurR/RpiR family transcriptional regulator
MAPYFFFLSDTDAQALSPELLKAARWLEAHPGQAAMKSMRECARQAGVAPATLTRLAHALGHSGFEGLKALFQAGLAPDTNYAARAHALQLAASSDAADWTERLSEAQHANSASAFVLNSRADYDAVASTLLRAQKVNFLGLRASFGLAFHLHYSFGLLAPHGVLLQDIGGTLADQLARMGARDVIVVVSQAPYTRQTVSAAEQANAQGVSVVAVTDSVLSPLVQAAQHKLLFRTQSTSFFQSMVGALAVAEGLAAAVAVQGGSKVLAHLQTVQQQLDRQGAYWEKISRSRTIQSTESRVK